MKEKIISTFTELISYDTQSNPNSDTYPSTASQSAFGNVLIEKLIAMGLKAEADKYGYITAVLESNTDEKLPIIGFISHIDTSPDFSGSNIKPQIIENYNGKDIVLNGLTISPTEFPVLKNYVGKTLIISDGTTLLGGDDKAGVTEILTAMEYLIKNPQIKHGTVKIAFTPDEEIGCGVDYFDVEKFGCDFAYTIDGGILGEVSYENFNAARAKIDITGKSVHPGSAKDTMKNASLIAMELNSMLPENQIPSKTDGYDGFFHLTEINGNVSQCHLDYIIRDFDKTKFEAKKQIITDIVENIKSKYNCDAALELYDEYYNMAEIIEKNKNVLDTAVNAIKNAGVEPVVEPIRGGTDGARLSFMGLPCPNIFTGGHNFHGPYEFVCVESMMKAVEVIVNIVKI